MSVLTISLAVLTTVILSNSPAYAYLEPGTSSMIIQMIIGAIAGVGVTLKIYWHKVVGFLSSLRKDKP